MISIGFEWLLDTVAGCCGEPAHRPAPSLLGDSYVGSGPCACRGSFPLLQGGEIFQKDIGSAQSGTRNNYTL